MEPTEAPAHSLQSSSAGSSNTIKWYGCVNDHGCEHFQTKYYSVLYFEKIMHHDYVEIVPGVQGWSRNGNALSVFAT